MSSRDYWHIMSRYMHLSLYIYTDIYCKATLTPPLTTTLRTFGWGGLGAHSHIYIYRERERYIYIYTYIYIYMTICTYTYII